ncbi:MAG TPA: alpha-2-macroglobulin family protein, partial [Anseongella sp.]|nr:alpha-2-macroglobulin family protein [Anseongella sp.]
MLGFAHTRELLHGSITKELVTSKEVSVTANAPRFLRAGDRISFTAKVVNLTEGRLEGLARLLLLDALTLEPLDSLLLQGPAAREFDMEAHSSAALSWEIEVPQGLQALTYRVLASAGAYTDGEEKTVPVLPNSILVTETLPLQVAAGETGTFSVSSFAGGKLPTARPYRFTMEFTSNPAWYAVQSLPYLMEYPYECSEQMFSRYFANSLAAAIINSSPRIKTVFQQWKDAGSGELLSGLEKNQELKSALLEETPWVLQSKNDTERKKRLALLFDMNHMRQQNQSALRKLALMQLPDGSFPWFAGMRGNRFITQHILAGMGQLVHLNALPEEDAAKRDILIKNALEYTDGAFAEDFSQLAKTEKYASSDHLSAFVIHFMYMRSFYPELKPGAAVQKALDFYLSQAEEYWLYRGVYQQGMLALVLQRYGRPAAA